jgi:hypothetical protein
MSAARAGLAQATYLRQNKQAINKPRHTQTQPQPGSWPPLQGLTLVMATALSPSTPAASPADSDGGDRKNMNNSPHRALNMCSHRECAACGTGTCACILVAAELHWMLLTGSISHAAAELVFVALLSSFLVCQVTCECAALVPSSHLVPVLLLQIEVEVPQQPQEGGSEGAQLVRVLCSTQQSALLTAAESNDVHVQRGQPCRARSIVITTW